MRDLTKQFQLCASDLYISTTKYIWKLFREEQEFEISTTEKNWLPTQSWESLPIENKLESYMNELVDEVRLFDKSIRLYEGDVLVLYVDNQPKYQFSYAMRRWFTNKVESLNSKPILQQGEIKLFKEEVTKTKVYSILSLLA
ncbi:hypothetical protein N9901_03105 [Flavobacteriaceae bacterium]|nr:hypothetical protein [Flavobacteriaceae bacterium]